MDRTPPRSSPGSAPLRISDAGVLVAAVFAIASSALLVRWADAPAVTLAFWRTLGGAGFLAVVDVRRPDKIDNRDAGQPRRLWTTVVVAGLALGLHFATWLASLEMTSVAASVTIVSSAPLMIGVSMRLRGQSLSAATWAALILAVVGVAVIAGGDTTEAGSEAILGDVLALVGAAAMATYLIAGAELRRHWSTAAYTSRAYGVAAAALFGWAIITGLPLTGFDSVTWQAIVAMTLGPQLVGHTGLNHLLRRLGSLTVSLALLTEPVAATALVWVVLGEIPPITSLLGAPLVIGAVGLYLVAAPMNPVATPSANAKQQHHRLDSGTGCEPGPP